MNSDSTKKMIAQVFNEVANGIKSGNFKEKVKIGFTILGSEHGIDEMIKAAKLAKNKYGDFDIILIGKKVTDEFETIEVCNPEDGHKKMLEMLKNKQIDGCVTQHFDFPIGVSTVGRVITPGLGKEMIISTTTGTTSTNRVEGMVMNAISGISVAKALKINNPKVGILNVDGARQVERILSGIKQNGYNFEFAKSLRADGGAVMRGNDLLAGTPDVMVCDSLTGNLLIKIFGAYTTGGNYEISGYGYGPGVGKNYDKLINIISRASGAPLICEALRYCASCAQNRLLEISKKEFQMAQKFGMTEEINKIVKRGSSDKDENIKIPPKKVVTFAIPGIDILELEDACKVLWKEKVYCESGMGCTGPVILISEEDKVKSMKLLNKMGYVK